MSSYTTLPKLPNDKVLSLAISLDQEQQAAAQCQGFWNIFLTYSVCVFGKESEGLDLELPKRNDLLKHLTAKRFLKCSGGDTNNADAVSTDFFSPGIDDMKEASKIKCKKKLLGLLA